MPLSSAQEFLVDSYGRKIDSLRVSLTQACNFRCVYCLPESGLPKGPEHRDYLTRQEIVRFLSLASKLGITRVRLTGGEPLLRKDLVEIIADIKSKTAIQDLSITTNGSLLEPLLGPLKKAGLDRINISLDSLDANRFRDVTGVPAYEHVFDAVFAALREGFPVKLNMVILQGLSEEEILRYAHLAYEFPLEIRFLEFMPLCGENWQVEKVMTIEEVQQIVSRRYRLEAEKRPAGQVSQNYVLPGGKGKVGLIGSLTRSFCGDCSRLRLSAEGKIFPCLFSELFVNAGFLLKNLAPDEEILDAIRLAVSIKPPGNQFLEKPFDSRETFQVSSNPMIRTIGG